MWRGKGEAGELTTRKLAEMRERLVKMGIRAGMVQMEWGLRNLGSAFCESVSCQDSSRRKSGPEEGSARENRFPCILNLIM